MTLFSSRRERRLWLWVLAVMVAIYATLGLAQTLAETLRERGLLDISIGLFLLCMFLVGATILTQALKVRPGGAEVAVVIGVATAYLLVFTRMDGPDRALAPHRVWRGRRPHLRGPNGAQEPRPPRAATAPARRPGDRNAGRARRRHPGDSAKPRLRSGRHPVQPARRNHGCGSKRSAGVGAAVDTVAEVGFEMSGPQWLVGYSILPACAPRMEYNGAEGRVPRSLLLRET